LSKLGAGIFEINQTPQQSAGIFQHLPKTHPQEANHHGIYSQPRERMSQWQGSPTIQQTQPLPPFQYPPASTLST
jgi:hypothetical protein